mgnify:FL=1
MYRYCCITQLVLDKGESEDAGGVDRVAAGGAHSDSEDSTSQVSDAEGEADDEGAGIGSDVPGSISSILAQQQQRPVPDRRIPTPPPPAFTCEYPGCPAVSLGRV